MKPLVCRLAALVILMGLTFGFTADMAECADWLMITENEEGVFYADRETMAKGTVQMKEARELSVWKRSGDISRILEVVEYDCSEKRRRVIQALTYTTKGEVVLRSTLNAAWEPVLQQQTAIAFFNAACKK